MAGIRFGLTFYKSIPWLIINYSFQWSLITYAFIGTLLSYLFIKWYVLVTWFIYI